MPTISHSYNTRLALRRKLEILSTTATITTSTVDSNNSDAESSIVSAHLESEPESYNDVSSSEFPPIIRAEDLTMEKVFKILDERKKRVSSSHSSSEFPPIIRAEDLTMEKVFEILDERQKRVYSPLPRMTRLVSLEEQIRQSSDLQLASLVKTDATTQTESKISLIKINVIESKNIESKGNGYVKFQNEVEPAEEINAEEINASATSLPSSPAFDKLSKSEV